MLSEGREHRWRGWALLAFLTGLGWFASVGFWVTVRAFVEWVT